MPKSAVDATRFTSTTPHVSARPPASASSRTIPERTPGPPGETPQEKVKRLREAAARVRDAKVSTFDKIVIRGRVWADRAHRFTALSLIGITGIAGVVTVYALGDMIIYNRRKQRQYFAEQFALHNASVRQAQLAVQRGIASEEQQALVESEKRAAEAKNAPKPPGVFARSKAWLFSGLKSEEEGESFGASQPRLRPEGTNEGDDVMGTRESDIVRTIEKKEVEDKDKAEMTLLEREMVPAKAGGPLDQLGTNATPSSTSIGEAPKQGGSWAAFMSRR